MEQNKAGKRTACIGLLAHVDAGKTTLAEALLYKTGTVRKMGRVDHGDTLLDNDIRERERGITIFSSRADFVCGDLKVCLLDTPGHVDFSSEAERTLNILDYAVLVISGIDGVQSHTRTLWELLCSYHVPVIVFVTKMDFARKTKEELLKELKEELSPGCFDYSSLESEQENLALLREDLTEKYLENGSISKKDVAGLIIERSAYPCFFGSGLKLTGIDDFLSALPEIVIQRDFPDSFGARVFKISRDSQGNRLVHLKVTGGSLKVRDTVGTEKVNQIRVYSGGKFTQVDSVSGGDVCAVIGLDSVKNGEGLGFESPSSAPVLEPVMFYKIGLPEGCDPQVTFKKLKLLEDEDPCLHIRWDERLKEIHAGLMGSVQIEVLENIISERFGISVSIDSGRVLYKETVLSPVEGVGHYEPLRHYAEVHLLIEPLKRGSGIVLESDCSEDLLDRNWQRLILTHLAEKQHLGVLTGSPITDVMITLKSGRAHIKHTEGGDFRQATYRAVRQGLMKARSILLEPMYSYKLEVPGECLGAVINDIRSMSGTFDAPESLGDFTRLCGKVPVSTMNGYQSELASVTGGRGRLSLAFSGYEPCHDAEKVMETCGYDPERDLENTPDSVFCAHGGGFSVKWDSVEEYMHLESVIPGAHSQTVGTAGGAGIVSIDDREFEAIMDREFGPIKRPMYRAPENIVKDAERDYAPPAPVTFIIDGYNVIFGWDELKTLAEKDLDLARDRLMNVLCNYGSFLKQRIILVFDAYKSPGNPGKRFDYHNIFVVYTRENETGDMFIEKLVNDIGKNEKVKVVTNDNLIRLSAIHSGVLRVSVSDFADMIEKANAEMGEIVRKSGREKLGTVGENVKI